jgi:peptidoglycan/LPS O-acetylase OafA/YrhL
MAIFFSGVMGAVLLIGSSSWAALVNLAWLRYLGKISYCLYLVHQLCFWLYDKIATHVTASGLNIFMSICLRALVAVAAAVLMSEFSRRYFEGWFLQLKSWFAL